ncbi:MAG: hypothetical protein MHM6MM_004503 [Cercozoa sp. M6MM]
MCSSLIKQVLVSIVVLLLGATLSLLARSRPFETLDVGQSYVPMRLEQEQGNLVVRNLPPPSTSLNQCKAHIVDFKLWPRLNPSPYGVIAEGAHVDWTLSNASYYPLSFPIDFDNRAQLHALAAREILGLVPPTSARAQGWWHPRLPSLSATQKVESLWHQGRLVPVSVLVELDAKAVTMFRYPNPDFSFFRGCQLSTRGRPIADAVSWSAYIARSTVWKLKLGHALRVQAQVMCVFEKTEWTNFITASRNDERGEGGYTVTVQHGGETSHRDCKPALEVSVDSIVNVLEGETVTLGLNCGKNCVVALAPKLYGEAVPRQVAHWLKSVLQLSKLDGAILGVVTSHLSITYVQNQLCEHLGKDCCRVLAKTRFLPVHAPAAKGAVYSYGDAFVGTHLLPTLARAVHTVVFGDWDELFEIPRQNQRAFAAHTKNIVRALITSTSQDEIEKCSSALIEPQSAVRKLLDSKARRDFVLKWLHQFGCAMTLQGKTSWRPEEMVMFHNHADDAYSRAWRKRGIDATPRGSSDGAVLEATQHAARHNKHHALLPVSWLEVHLRLNTLDNVDKSTLAAAYAKMREWYTQPENAWKDNPSHEARRALQLLLEQPNFEPFLWHARIVKSPEVGGVTLREERVRDWHRARRAARAVNGSAEMPFPASLVVTGDFKCDHEPACACSCVEFLKLAQRLELSSGMANASQTP